MDKLWAMEVFVRVMECGSLSRAAESLNLANATVTSSLRNLEAHLGVTLIQRNSRYLRLTEEGRLFLPRCQEILKNMSRAETELKGRTTDVSGLLRVESPFAIGQNLIVPALPELARRYPGLSVSMTLANSPHSLIERAVDVAIRMDGVEDAELVGWPIHEAAYLVCAAPSVADALDAASPHDLDPARCLGRLVKGSLEPNPWVFTQGSEEVEIHPRGPLNFNNSESLIQAALREVGLIHVLDIFVADLIDQGKLVPLFPGWQIGKRTFYAATVKSRFAAPKVRAFVDFLLEAFDPRRRSNVRSIVPIGSARKTKTPH